MFIRKHLLKNLNTTAFTCENKSLFGGSIGAHFRHIIEFYLCCLEQKDSGIINYDLRKRDIDLEKNIFLGIETIDKIVGLLQEFDYGHSTPILHESCLSTTCDSKKIESSFQRELSYCMHHCIHHQSLIKIALHEQGLLHLIDENFGVAFSTQKHRQECV